MPVTLHRSALPPAPDLSAWADIPVAIAVDTVPDARQIDPAIRQHFPQEVTMTDPEGGLFTWARFPDGFDATAFMRDHALPKARVAYVPGGSFFATTPRPNHARINFSAPSEDRIRQGIAALGATLKAQM